MSWWQFLTPDEQWGVLVVGLIFACALASRLERRPTMVKPNKQQGSVAVMDDPPGDLLVARNDELKRLREARTLLEGCNPSVWTSDVLSDLERWERHVQTKQRQN